MTATAVTNHTAGGVLTMTTEKRRFARVPFNTLARLTAADGRQWFTSLLDVSLKGVLLQRPDHWSGLLGDHYALEFYLGGSPQTVRMADTVLSHLETACLGLHCLSIDLESITHLKSLLELNTGDPELIQRELTELWSGHEERG